MKKKLLLTLGILLLSASYSQAQQNTPLRRIEKNGKWGYVDDKGKEVIPCKYDYAYPFYDSDLALVGSDGKFGFINKQGRMEIPLQYQKAYPFSEDRAAVKKGNKYGFVTSSGYEIIKPQYSDVKWGFIDGYAWVKKGNKWGMINKWGTKAIEFDYTDLSYFDANTGAANAVTISGVTHFFAKSKMYSSKKERDDAICPKKPIIAWPFIPNSVKESLFVLNAEIKSDSKIDYCKVYLNRNEAISYQDRKAPLSINQLLTLSEGSNNIIIEVKNAGGVTKEAKTINFNESLSVNKPVIVTNNFPSEVTSSLLTVTAEITSESEITDCSIYLKEGNIVPGGSYRAPDIIENKKKTISKTLTLYEGRNTIVVEATNAGGTTKKESIVNYVKLAPPTISWISKISDKTTKPQFTVEASINSKSDVSWNISMISTGTTKTKGSVRIQDIIEIASGKGSNAKGYVTLKPGYNTISVEATNASGKKTESKTIWYSPCEKRIALVIGNRDYTYFDDLNKTLNDADTIANLLEKECSFDVIKVKDADYSTMGNKINEFIDRIKDDKYQTAFIYFSGHGISFSSEKGDNYLIPKNCRKCKQDIESYGFDIKTKLLDRLDKEAKSCMVKIAMLDCCRSNDVKDCSSAPSSGTKGTFTTKGLSKMDIPNGIAVFYGAEFGKISYDGDSNNSPFVECFVDYFRKHPKANWNVLGREVMKKVSKMTEKGDYGPQRPVNDINKFDGAEEFYLNPYHDKP